MSLGIMLVSAGAALLHVAAGLIVAGILVALAGLVLVDVGGDRS